MKGLYLKIRNAFVLLFSKQYVLVAIKKRDRLDICHNLHCTTCCTDFLEQSYGLMCEIEEYEVDQSDAVDLANRIINNKN